MRVCGKCGVEKPAKAFYPNGKGGRAGTCIACAKAAYRARKRREPDACKHPGGCGKPAQPNRGGWCAMHAARIEREGSPGGVGARRRGRVVTPDEVGMVVVGNEFRGVGLLRCYRCGVLSRDHSLTVRCG